MFPLRNWTISSKPASGYCDSETDQSGDSGCAAYLCSRSLAFCVWYSVSVMAPLSRACWRSMSCWPVVGACGRLVVPPPSWRFRQPVRSMDPLIAVSVRSEIRFMGGMELFSVVSSEWTDHRDFCSVQLKLSVGNGLALVQRFSVARIFRLRKRHSSWWSVSMMCPRILVPKSGAFLNLLAASAALVASLPSS